MKAKLILIVLLSVSYNIQLIAQEFRCNVSVNARQIQGTNRQVYEDMQTAIREFINERRWTEHVFDIDERIECSFMINITQQIGSDRFSGTLTVQSSRPIYNTAYKSTLLNLKEKDNNLQFQYREGEPIEFDLNSHKSNLSSVLAFYAYVILGLDYDSFSNEGGTEFFEKAKRIVDNAQSSADPGWKAYEDVKRKNRYWLIENLTNDKYSAVRRASYRYHRLGLDVMSSKESQGRSVIAESFKLLTNVYRSEPNSFIMDIFLTAKSDEIVDLFSYSGVPAMEKSVVYQAITEIDAINASKYSKIKE